MKMYSSKNKISRSSQDDLLLVCGITHLKVNDIVKEEENDG